MKKHAFRKPMALLMTLAMVASLLPALTISAKAAGTTLSTGDIAFVGINSDGDDDFAFVLLKDITAETSLYITDKGWNDGSGFFTTSGDGIWQWSTASALTAGTVVHIKTTNNGTKEAGSLAATPGSVEWVEDNGTVISYTGDQLFLYQGTAASPTIITGIHWNVETGTTSGNWDGSGTTVTTSALPDQLTNGTNAIWLYGSVPSVPTERDNFRYKESATYSGTPAVLSAAINNLANWAVDTTDTTAYPINPFLPYFTVTRTAPTFSSGATANFAENGTGTAYTAAATASSGTVSYSLTGSTDDSLFNIDSSSGAVTFKTAPNYESPADSDTNNVYNITVTATDSSGSTARNVAITVTDVDDLPHITSAAYDASTNVLSVTGANMTAGDTIDATKLTVRGQGGSTYAYTLAGSYTVTASSATAFSVTLNSADQAKVEALLNKDGTSSLDSTTYNLAGAANWDATKSAAADASDNGITVSNANPRTTLTFETGTGSFDGNGTSLMTFTTSGTNVTYTFTAIDVVNNTADLVWRGASQGTPIAHNGSDSVYFGWNNKDKSTTMAIQNGKTFDLISFYLSNQNTSDEIFVITTSKDGSYNTGSLPFYLDLHPDLITLPSDPKFQGISWFTIAPLSSSGAYMEIDDIVLANIVSSNTAPSVTTSTVSTYTGTSGTMGGSVTADGGGAVTERAWYTLQSTIPPRLGKRTL